MTESEKIEELKNKLQQIANPYCQYVNSQKIGKGVFFSYENTDAYIKDLVALIHPLTEALQKIISHKESGGFNKWHETIVSIANEALPEYIKSK